MKLVLLPGLGGTGEFFENLIPNLAPSIESVSICYSMTEEMSYENLTDYVGAQLPIDRDYVILAESFSGPIAIAIAAKNPPKLRGLLLSCTFSESPRPEFKKLRNITWIPPFRFVPKMLLGYYLINDPGNSDLIDKIADVMSNVHRSVLRCRVQSVLSVNYTSMLNDISVPIRYLKARDDRVLPRNCADKITECVDQIEVVELAGPHLLLQVRSKESAEHINGFVQQISNKNDT